MKTLDEAVTAIRKAVEVSALHSVIYVHSNGSTDKPITGTAQQSIVEIMHDVHHNSEIKGLLVGIVDALLTLPEHQRVSALAYTAITYGIRIGMEMEKQDV